MILVAFLLGVACGLLLPRLRTLLKGGLRMPLGEDEKYLLRAARAAKGRLILKQASGSSGSSLLLLKEFPDTRRLENTMQIEKLLARKFIQADDSGKPGRFVLTSKGWAQSKDLPEFPLQPIRQGAWFNSISRSLGRAARK